MAGTYLDAVDTIAGKGVCHPFQQSGYTRVSEGLERIRHAMWTLITVKPFDIYFRPKGSRLMELLFDPIDQVLLDLVYVYVQEALESYQAIDLLQLGVKEDGEDSHKIQITIAYRIRRTNIRDEYMFTFDLAALQGGEV